MSPGRKKAIDTLHSIQAKPLKSFGQNFLVDRNILAKIVTASGISSRDSLLEIGPGLGTLTEAFLEKGASVTAVEKDRKLFRYLTERFQKRAGLRLVLGDFLKWSPEDDLSLAGPFKLVANIPYSISTQIILKVIMESGLFPEAYLGIQKEVADRLCSRGGSKVYGLLSPLVQLEYDARILFLISPGCFHPVPAVMSAWLSLKRKALYPKEEKEKFFLFLKRSFGQRRKKLINNLKPYYQEESVKRALSSLSLGENVRPEQVGPDIFFRLFRMMSCE